MARACRGMSAQQHSQELWRKLRQPFPLTSEMKRYHTCQWELIDMDMAGCRLCGSIHVCKDRQCQTVSTEDAEVCTITGLCVRDCIYAETEFADTVASYNMGSVTSEKSPGVDRMMVFTYVEQLLKSENSQRAYTIEINRFRAKIQSLVQSEINYHAGGSINLVEAIEKVLGTLQHSRVFRPRCDGDTRQALIDECTDFICFLINSCAFFLKVNTRSSEIRVLVFGLLYLMRSGVEIDGISVIPRVPLLKSLLPAENTLQSVHDFRPKFITDVENKYKYLFRSMPPRDLRMLSLHSRKVTGMSRNDGGAED